MRKILLYLALLCFLPAFFAPLPADAETIKSFQSTIHIREDSSFFVCEELLIDVDNTEIKHGIKRYIPIKYKDQNGNSFSVGFDVTDVKIDGEDASYSVSRNGDYADLTIGDADEIIPAGPHTFTIEYTTKRQIGFFEDFDELYWNVTGNGWSWPIESASCRVFLPEKDSGVPFRSIEWYVGEYGERGEKDDARLAADNTVVTTKPLRPHEGLTVVYTWQKGLVTPPPSPYGNTFAQTAVACLAFLFSLAWLLFTVFKKSSAHSPAVIARFYPPANASPAFVRYIWNSNVDGVSFTSDIIGLAVKGALKIEERQGEKGLLGKAKSKFILTREESNVLLTEDEELLMEKLFGGNRDSLTVDKSYSKVLSAAFRGLSGKILNLGRGLRSDNIKFALTGVLILIAGIACTLPFLGDDTDPVILSAFFGCFAIFPSLFRKPKPKTGFFPKLGNSIISLIPALIVSFIAFAIFSEDDPYLLKIVLPFIAAAGATSLIRPLTAKLSDKGEELFAEVEGLRLYITVAEKDRMEMLNAPEETPELFERLLPYATALDAAKTWATRFEKVLEKASYNPQWYTGPSPLIFMYGSSFGDFSHAVNSTIASASKPVFSPTISSGSGGRGFSGGGGGGGGGSGW